MVIMLEFISNFYWKLIIKWINATKFEEPITKDLDSPNEL